jgi:glycine hydroxymethyltransferase
LTEAQTQYQTIFRLLQQHHTLFQEEAIVTDFSNRYAEGWPGERVYAGCSYIDDVELICIDLAKQVFGAEFVDVRPISGVVANLAIYSTFAQPGDLMLALSIPCGGHISMGKERFGGTAGAVRGLRVDYFPYDYDNFTIDVDQTKAKLRELVRDNNIPALAMFGGSVLPFPQPVGELEAVLHEMDVKINYDAAHVSGLIAGNTFQDPIREGVDSMTLSTHKTFPGPQHGMILSWNKYADQIKRATFPGVVSNHHLHNVAGVAVALAEMKEFGEDYSQQIIKNSKALGQALFERDMKVLGEHRGFSESHVVWVDIWEYGDGGQIEADLEKANIIANRNLLPWDIKMGRHYTHPGGIRLGTPEVTRLGMQESEMEVIADFIKRVVVDKEDATKIANDVIAFRKEYQRVHYCFDDATAAYKYVNIR